MEYAELWSGRDYTLCVCCGKENRETASHSFSASDPWHGAPVNGGLSLVKTEKFVVGYIPVSGAQVIRVARYLILDGLDG